MYVCVSGIFDCARTLGQKESIITLHVLVNFSMDFFNRRIFGGTLNLDLIVAKIIFGDAIFRSCSNGVGFSAG